VRDDPFADHSLHAGVLVPVLGHSTQDIDEYSAMQDFATRRNTDAHSIFTRYRAKDTNSQKETNIIITC